MPISPYWGSVYKNDYLKLKYSLSHRMVPDVIYEEQVDVYSGMFDVPAGIILVKYQCHFH